MKLLRYFLSLFLATGLVLAPVTTAHAGLEAGTYISDLVSTNPTAGDPVSQGDDHVRLIKSTVLATFPNVTGAVTPTHTELNYVDGVTSAIQTQLDQAKVTNGTAVASTSGTSIDFTSIPSWVKRITISLVGVSTNGTSPVMVQLGDSGGVEATGYLGSGMNIGGSATSEQVFTAGFGLQNTNSAATVVHGSVVLTLVDAASFTWVASSTIGASNTAGLFLGAGSKSLSTTLDRVRITTLGGVNTFDAGSINVQYD